MSIVRGALLSPIGSLELTRFNTSANPATDTVQLLYESIGHFETALQILPTDLAEARAACQANLGLAYFSAGGDPTRAVPSFQEALAFYESSGNVYKVGTGRLNLARVYEAAGDLDRSRIFAEAALRSFASLAPNAEDDLVDAQDLLGHLNTQ
jgi:tetratricopeptide (TPR) repeat protein